MLNLADHAPDGRGVFKDRAAVHLAQSKTLEVFPLISSASDAAPDERHFDLFSHDWVPLSIHHSASPVPVPLH